LKVPEARAPVNDPLIEAAAGTPGRRRPGSKVFEYVYFPQCD
jgi:hypothetical protein